MFFSEAVNASTILGGSAAGRGRGQTCPVLISYDNRFKGGTALPNRSGYEILHGKHRLFPRGGEARKFRTFFVFNHGSFEVSQMQVIAGHGHVTSALPTL